MLESCATVDEAIAFYKKYQEASFSTAKIMIADKTGASVIIGVRNGQLYFDKSSQSRGFGYGEKALNQLLLNAPQPTLKSGLPILKACEQQGQFATKYSSIYNLQSGEIFIVSSGNPQTEITLNLSNELAKGGHYYDMPLINHQQNQAILELRPGMKRFIYDGYTPISDPDHLLDKRFKKIIENSATGSLKQEEFATALWKQITPILKDIQEDLKKMGKIQSFTLLERKELNHERSYLYRIDFENAIILQRFVLNDQNQLEVLKPEGWEQKSK